MSKRLTADREQEIRDECGDELGWPQNIIRELLAEIDALRADWETATHNSNDWQLKARELEKERDQLDDELASANLLIDQLKAENKRLLELSLQIKAIAQDDKEEKQV